MNITKSFNKPFFRIIISIILGLLVFILSRYFADITTNNLPNIIKPENHLGKNFIFKLFMLILSVIIILLLNGGKLYSYGFNKGKNVNYARIIWISFILSIICLVIVIILNIFYFVITKTEPKGFDAAPFYQTIIFVWLWSSICEEVLSRGLIQGFLEPLVKFKIYVFKKNISLPVFVAALFFSCMHLSLLKTGMSLSLVIGILISTFILGIIAGYYREKTGSLIPAILCHIVFNIGGSLPIIIKYLIEFLTV
ncbi:MAG: CPBP family intramembrane metalloprotease [Bacteroidales bacterium]|nr:CPBP family intramembrane metalloprotease [Bacteroidales bacterium]